jgi:hypothetical protein
MASEILPRNQETGRQFVLNGQTPIGGIQIPAALPLQGTGGTLVSGLTDQTDPAPFVLEQGSTQWRSSLLRERCHSQGRCSGHHSGRHRDRYQSRREKRFFREAHSEPRQALFGDRSFNGSVRKLPGSSDKVTC